MQDDRYAPPRAAVADPAAPLSATGSPPLWNPNAAGFWSLLFSPAFGAFLHAANWNALGELEKAKTSRIWAWVSLAGLGIVAVLSAFFPEGAGADSASRAIAIGLLVGWWTQSGNVQRKFVRDRFGTTYPRRGWGKPLGFALLVVVAFFALVFILALLAAAVQGGLSADAARKRAALALRPAYVEGGAIKRQVSAARGSGARGEPPLRTPCRAGCASHLRSESSCTSC